MENAAPTDANRISAFNVEPPYQEFFLGWPAYIGPAVGFLSFGAVGGIVTAVFWPIGVLMLLVALLTLIYRVLLIRSTKLFTHPEGVWVFSGVFPWNRGLSGARWRDVREATFGQSFFTWLFKTYPVTVTNRYQGNSEVSLQHVKHGDEAVMHINDLLHRVPGARADAVDLATVAQA